MHYQTALQSLYNLSSKGIKLGLDRIIKAARLLNISHPDAYIIQVAGTNGKGTVSHLLETAYRQAGKKTALFTSPHLHKFTERIRINGAQIPEQKVSALISDVLSVISTHNISLTFFEVTTLVAMKAFIENGVDVIILEVGLGGRLDATSAFTPGCTAITSIGMDHTDFLGDTIEQIAKEKAGISKQNIPLYCGPLSDEATAVIKREAQISDAPLFILGRDFQVDHSMNIFRPGNHQQQNTTLAKQIFINTADTLNINNAATIFNQSLPETFLPARFEKISTATGNFLIDGAHNKPAMSALCDTITKLDLPVATIIFGALNNKPSADMLKTLQSICSNIIVAAPPVARSFNAVLFAKTHSLNYAKTVGDALRMVQTNSSDNPKSITLITGSFFLAADARRILLNLPADPPIAM